MHLWDYLPHELLMAEAVHFEVDLDEAMVTTLLVSVHLFSVCSLVFCLSILRAANLVVPVYT